MWNFLVEMIKNDFGLNWYIWNNTSPILFLKYTMDPICLPLYSLKHFSQANLFSCSYVLCCLKSCFDPVTLYLLCYVLMDYLTLYRIFSMEQVCSSRDISRSSLAEAASENSNNRRLLLLKLTDGHNEITAIEYSHVPSFPDDISPGTKVLALKTFLMPVVSLSHVIPKLTWLNCHQMN